MADIHQMYGSPDQQQEAIERLKRVDGRDGGGNNGGMEARVAKLEAHVEHIQQDISEVKSDIKDMRKAMDSDFKILAGMIIAGVLGLTGVMAKGFGWL